MLRNRLYIGLLPVLTILLIMGLFSVYLFHDIDKNFQRIQMENYGSILAVQTVAFECTLIDRAVTLNNIGQSKLAMEMYNERVENIERALGNAAAAHLPATESALYDKLQETVSAYVKSMKPLPATPGEMEPASIVRRYDLLDKIINMSEQIKDINAQSIGAQAEHFRRTVWLSSLIILLGMGAAFVLALIFSYAMSERIVAPIERLTESARKVSQGDLTQKLDLKARDEMGVLAKTFDDMMAQLRDFRRASDMKLIRTRQRMEACLGNFPDPVFFIDSQGQIIYENPRSRTLTEAEEWKELLEIINEDAALARQRNEDIVRRNLKEATIARIDGEEKFFLMQTVIMDSDIEGETDVAVILSDVTRLRLSDDLRSNLVATVSHEIRTPLTSVRMALYLILEQQIGKLNESQEELLETAKGDVDRLLKLLDNILDLSRLEAGAARLDLKSLDVQPLLREITTIFKEPLQEKHLTLTVKVEDDIPPVYADYDRVLIVLSNLLSNALKHAPENSEITLSVIKYSDQAVRYSITDVGPQVPKDKAKLIFERFYRVPGQSTVGAGLGLSIAREIVIAHGGSIGYENHEVGKSFYFVLPISKDAYEAAHNA